MISEGTTLQIIRLLQVRALEFFLKPEWGAQNATHREDIKAHLQTQIRGKESSSSFSISHAAGVGGYALLHRAPHEQVQIGFDLELISRVTEPIARRVCQEESEFLQAPTPSALWCAKESAFKSLQGPHQPEVLPLVKISRWNRNSQFEIFEFSVNHNSPPRKTLGISWSKDVYQLGVSCVWF